MKDTGTSLGMVVALAKKMAIQYGSLGLSNVEAVVPNGIKFTFTGGATYTVYLTFSAAGVSFDNSGKTITSTTVQGALNELYTSLQDRVISLNNIKGDASIIQGTSHNITITNDTTNKTIALDAIIPDPKVVSDFDLTVGSESITYDTTDGATISANGTITYTDATSDTFTSSYNLPIVAGNGISMDANAAGTQLVVKSVAEYITISASSTATSGTLTSEQLTKLQSSENVHIMFNNELYRMQSKGHTSGYITYAMSEYENNKFTSKSITVTISTGGWVLNTADINEFFNCTYGTTTYAQIESAVNNGRIPTILHDGNRYIWSTSDSSKHIFSCVKSNVVDSVITVTNADAWSVANVTLEDSINKVTTLDSSSTSTQYPSAQTVYIELQKKQNIVTYSSTSPSSPKEKDLWVKPVTYYKHNDYEVESPSWYKTTSSSTITISATGITSGTSSYAWDEVTDTLINGWVTSGDLETTTFADRDCGKYGNDNYDYKTSFTENTSYELYIYESSTWKKISSGGGSGGSGYQPDNSSIDLNSSNQLEIKDTGITFAKFASAIISNAIATTSPSSEKITTENAVRTELDKKENKLTISTSEPTGEESDLWVKKIVTYTHNGTAFTNPTFYKKSETSTITIDASGITNGGMLISWIDLTDLHINSLVSSGDLISATFSDMDCAKYGTSKYDYKTTFTETITYELYVYKDGWNKISSSGSSGGYEPDNTTIELDSSNKLSVAIGTADNGITTSNFKTDVLSTSIPSTGASDTKIPTEKAVKDAITNLISASREITLSASGWDATTKQQTVSVTLDVDKRNDIDVSMGSLEEWTLSGIRGITETSSGITFQCEEIPSTDLKFRVLSMDIDYPSSYTINTTLTNCTADSSNPTEIAPSGTVNLVFNASTGYRFQKNVYVTGATISGWTWGAGYESTITLTLTNPTSNVTVKIDTVLEAGLYQTGTTTQIYDEGTIADRMWLIYASAGTTYEVSGGWNTIPAGDLVFINPCTGIENNGFANVDFSAITGLTLPNEMSTVGNNAFMKYAGYDFNIQKVTIMNEGTMTFGTNAFGNDETVSPGKLRLNGTGPTLYSYNGTTQTGVNGVYF